MIPWKKELQMMCMKKRLIMKNIKSSLHVHNVKRFLITYKVWRFICWVIILEWVQEGGVSQVVLEIDGEAQSTNVMVSSKDESAEILKNIEEIHEWRRT